MGEINNRNYSYELQEVLSYMIDILVNEFPTEVFTPEYLIVSILDTKKCHANMFLDNYLMSNNMEELREIYTSVLKNNENLSIFCSFTTSSRSRTVTPLFFKSDFACLKFEV